MANKNPPLTTENRQLTRLVPADSESEARFKRQPPARDGQTAEVAVAGPRSMADGASVSGRWLLAIPDTVAAVSGSFRTFTEQHMAAGGLTELHRESWYGRDELLTVFARLEAAVGVQIVERIGRFLPAILESPPGVTNLQAALSAFEDWYGMWHRESSDTVSFRTVGAATGELVLATPYPDQFERGLVRGFIYEFGADGEYARLSGQETDADGATRYEITFFGRQPSTD
ncbi:MULTISPECIES: hypothetical protein [Haloarcula]|uniref:hypothetical protein n=1 Tax=Haloarcula TaxID=2237 RepID=UPI0023E7E339|nr:hypothetical protein [Halomicroarcula sp. SHR3]